MKTCKKCNIEFEGKNCPYCKAIWYQNNKEKVLARVLEWGRNNRDAKNKHAKSWYEANHDRARSNNKAWQSVNAKVKIVHAQNRRARIKQSLGKLSTGLAHRLYKLQKGKCAGCYARLSKYHLDHNMPLFLGGSNTDDNIQLLCPRCNLSKGAKHPIDFMQSIGYLL
jgi:5-methylcytosine-specific restriction endonuclease McrA